MIRKGIRPRFRFGPGRDSDAAWRHEFPFKRPWPVIAVVAVLDVVFLFPAIATARQIGDFGGMDSLFDLVGVIFLSAWLLGWSLAPLALTAVLLVLLAGIFWLGVWWQLADSPLPRVQMIDERYYMEMALGYAELKDELPDLEDHDEVLAVDLRDRDADDVFTSIAYEKGSLFLYELELAVGREAFDRFLMNYFAEFAFRSISTEEFLDYVERTLVADHAESVSMERIGVPSRSSGAIFQKGH